MVNINFLKKKKRVKFYNKKNSIIKVFNKKMTILYYSEKNNKDTAYSNDSLLVYGVGDGGGGPLMKYSVIFK